MATSFFSFLTKHKLPTRATLRALLARPLSWYGVGLYALCAAILITLYILIIVLNSRLLVSIPARGGTLVEGVIGAPHVINPVIATTQTDIDLTHLVYSGLTRKLADGTYGIDLASGYTVSTDGLVYTFTLPDTLKWSDGKPLTSTDVAFTFSKLTDPALRSDNDWQGVLVDTPDPTTVVFTLTAPHPDFLAQVSVGIIPAHIWNDVLDEAFDTARENIMTVGSGPFKIARVIKKNDIIQELHLVRNTHYAHDRPNIDRYTVRFFANQQVLRSALESGSIDMTLAATPDTAAHLTDGTYTTSPIASTETAGLYALTGSLSTGQIGALNSKIDKSSILAIVDYGYGILPPSSPTSTDALPSTLSVAVESNTLDLAQAFAQALKALGTDVTVKSFDHGTFQDIVTGRQYPLYIARTAHPGNGYETAVPLYQSAYPLVTKTSVHLFMPAYMDSPTDRYVSLTQWHIRTNNVWKPFTKQ